MAGIRGLGWAGAGLGCLVILSFFGRAVWVFDLPASFRPQLSACALALASPALFVKPRGPALAGAGAAVLGLVAMVPHLVDTGPSIAEGSPTITVMSFNVGISNPNRQEVADYIGEVDPDVVFIFESSFEWEDAIRASDLPLQIVSIVPRGRLAGVTVLVNPDLRPGRIDVDLDGEVAAVSVDLGDRRVEVLGIHPFSPTTSIRAGARDRLLADAAGWIAGRPGEVVVVGDLNATPWSHAFTRLRIDGGLIDTLRGRGLQPSWPEGWGPLMIPIDHVLHTRGLASVGRRTGPALGSAHRPVVVEIGFAG